MQYVNKAVVLPTHHAERSVSDRVFILAWRLLGGRFKKARVGVNSAGWITPCYFAKKRVRVLANT